MSSNCVNTPEVLLHHREAADSEKYATILVYLSLNNLETQGPLILLMYCTILYISPKLSLKITLLVHSHAL